MYNFHTVFELKIK